MNILQTSLCILLASSLTACFTTKTETLNVESHVEIFRLPLEQSSFGAAERKLFSERNDSKLIGTRNSPNTNAYSFDERTIIDNRLYQQKSGVYLKDKFSPAPYAVSYNDYRFKFFCAPDANWYDCSVILLKAERHIYSSSAKKYLNTLTGREIVQGLLNSSYYPITLNFQTPYDIEIIRNTLRQYGLEHEQIIFNGGDGSIDFYYTDNDLGSVIGRIYMSRGKYGYDVTVKMSLKAKRNKRNIYDWHALNSVITQKLIAIFQ